MTKEPFYECPSFQRCSVNQCPLDPKMLKRRIMDADKGQKCSAQRATREAIACKYPELPTGGLTLAEVARDERRAKARARWEALSPEQRAARLQPFKPKTDAAGEPDVK